MTRVVECMFLGVALLIASFATEGQVRDMRINIAICIFALAMIALVTAAAFTSYNSKLGWIFRRQVPSNVLKVYLLWVSSTTFVLQTAIFFVHVSVSLFDMIIVGIAGIAVLLLLLSVFSHPVRSTS